MLQSNHKARSLNIQIFPEGKSRQFKSTTQIQNHEENNAHVSLAQSVERLQDLVMEQVLHAGPRLTRLPLSLLLDQDVQHLLQVGRDVSVCHWGFIVCKTKGGLFSLLH